MRLTRSARLLPALALLLATPPAPAQPMPPINLTPAATSKAADADFVDVPVGLTPAQASRFKTALDTLAAQGHACIIAEDAPLHPFVTLDKAPPIPDHTPLGAAVALVAAAYDYDAARAGNMFTLTKRYSDPADLPDVTIEECAEDMHNAAFALRAYDPTGGQGGGPGVDPDRDQIAAILGVLPPDQWRAIFSKQGLPVAVLGAGARAAVDRWNLGMYLDFPTGEAQGYASAMSHAAQASVGVSTTDGGVTAFGKRVYAGTWGLLFQTFDDEPYTTHITTAAGWDMAPAQLAAAKARAAQRKADGHESLARVVAALAGGGAHFEVAPALAAKSVTAAGEGNAKPDAVLAGLARVYGLRVRLRYRDGVTVLDLPERVLPVDVAAVGVAVTGLLPAPLLRASHLLDGGAPDARLAQLRQHLSILEQAGGNSQEMGVTRRELTTEFQKREEEPYVAHRAAVWALRVASELYPASAKVSGLLPVSAMTADDRATYAAAIMLPCVCQMRGVVTTVTGSTIALEEGDQCVLMAGVHAQPDSRGTWKVSLDISKLRPDGTLQSAGGMAQVEYDGPLPPDAAASEASPTAAAP